MPTPCYLTIKGEKQGLISADAFTADSVGNIFQEGHENEILIQSVSHGVSVPTDPQSGQPSGQRVHSSLVVTCALDRATPLLFNAVVSGEKLPEVVLRWYRTSIEGKQEHFFTHTLTDAIATSIDLTMPHAQDSDNKNYTQFVSISFSYRKMELNHLISSTSGADDWRKPLT